MQLPCVLIKLVLEGKGWLLIDLLELDSEFQTSMIFVSVSHTQYSFVEI